MGVNIKNLIAAINPDVYCEPSKVKKVKKIIVEKGYLEAAKEAKLKSSDSIDIWHTVFTEGAFRLQGIENPFEHNKLAYDAFSQSLEPIYFWIVDKIASEYNKGSEKLIDNFEATPGSGFFSELSGKATRMQEEAMKMMGTANTVLRSVLNIIYDLKEFKLRLAQYDDYHSKDEKIKHAALLSLKQIWMDSVDIKRGNSAIKGLAQQFDYVTLIDAFMSSNSVDDVKKLDLNDRVKRILEQRIAEFFRWVNESEKELRKRFDIEKTYLRSQVNALKLYAKWIKPYLKSAQMLQQTEMKDSSLVKSFNTAIFQLSLLARNGWGPEQDIRDGILPEYFKKLKMREYNLYVLVEFKFRSAPDRADQRGGYGFRGRVEVEFLSFVLNDDEIKELRKEITKDEIGDLYKLIEGATDDSLARIQEDIDEFLEDNIDKHLKSKKKEEKKESTDINPFSALFSFMKRKKKEPAKDENGEEIKLIKPDSREEKVLRSQALLIARWKCRQLYRDFKKSLGMPSLPPRTIQ